MQNDLAMSTDLKEKIVKRGQNSNMYIYIYILIEHGPDPISAIAFPILKTSIDKREEMDIISPSDPIEARAGSSSRRVENGTKKPGLGQGLSAV